MPAKIEISYRTIIFVFLFIFTLWLLHEVRDILILLFIAFILTSALNPSVDRWERRGLPRVLAIFIFYTLGIILFVLGTTNLIPPLISESIHLGNRLPGYLSFVLGYLNLQSLDVQSFTDQLGPLGENLLRLGLGVFSNILGVVTILVFTFYFLLEHKHLEQYLRGFLGENQVSKVITMLGQIENRLGAWVRGQLILMLTIGITSYIGLVLLQVDYALALAILAGILEIVPIVGPIISAIPAIVVAISTSASPLLGLAVAGLYFIIQLLENHLLVPSVMRRTVDLPPLVTLIALMIGARLGGIGGALLAIPLVVTGRVIISELFFRK